MGNPVMSVHLSLQHCLGHDLSPFFSLVCSLFCMDPQDVAFEGKQDHRFFRSCTNYFSSFFQVLSRSTAKHIFSLVFSSITFFSLSCSKSSQRWSIWCLEKSISVARGLTILGSFCWQHSNCSHCSHHISFDNIKIHHEQHIAFDSNRVARHDFVVEASERVIWHHPQPLSAGLQVTTSWPPDGFRLSSRCQTLSTFIKRQLPTIGSTQQPSWEAEFRLPRKRTHEKMSDWSQSKIKIRNHKITRATSWFIVPWVFKNKELCSCTGNFVCWTRNRRRFHHCRGQFFIALLRVVVGGRFQCAPAHSSRRSHSKEQKQSARTFT